MIREEAIAYFKYHRKIFCEDYLKICPKDSIAYQTTLKEKEFYDMAIKSLEQEPTTIRKVGKWEYVGDNCFKCTECGEVYTMNQFNDINNYCDSRFPKGCPNCGAYIYER